MNGEKLLVIASYPPKGIIHDKSVVGIASYTKNTLLSLKKYSSSLSITVLAEVLDKKQNYEDGGIDVKRVWKRGSFFSFFSLLKEVLFLKNTKNVLIEFEVAMFGDSRHLLPLPIFILVLRLLGKKITIVLHQVIFDIQDLSGHINLNRGIKTYLLNFSIKWFYKLMLIIVNKIIVFDSVLKDSLSRFGNSEAVFVIPHGVEIFNNKLTTADARKKLGIKKSDFVLLCFGYLAWYKGTDLLIDYYKDLQNKDKSVKLIIAGGANPNHREKDYYQIYIKNLEEECKQNGITLTGFVDEKDIPLYFKASDLVVLPYRTLMSASGPLSIAFSFRKPFIVSEKLSALFDTKDIKSTLDETKVEKENIIFGDDNFEEKVLSIKTNAHLEEALENLSEITARKRDWDKLARLYYNLFFKNNEH